MPRRASSRQWHVEEEEVIVVVQLNLVIPNVENPTGYSVTYIEISAIKDNILT